MKKKKLDYKMLILIIIVCISLTLVLRDAYSRYTSKEVISDNAYVAQFIVEDTLKDSFNIKLEDMKPGESQSYEFTVSNFKNDKVADVSTNCVITVKTSNNLPLTIELNKNKNETNLVTKSFEDSNKIIYTSQEQILNAGEKQTDTYTLKINWPSTTENKNVKYVDELDYVDIYLDAVQIQPGE